MRWLIYLGAGAFLGVLASIATTLGVWPDLSYLQFCVAVMVVLTVGQVIGYLEDQL